MKNILSVLSITLVTTTFFIACNNSTSSTSSSKDSTSNGSSADTRAAKDSTPVASRKALLAATEIYTCSMHNQVIGEKPGHCSICGMELVKQKPTEEQRKLISEGSYKIPKE